MRTFAEVKAGTKFRTTVDGKEHVLVEDDVMLVNEVSEESMLVWCAGRSIVFAKWDVRLLTADSAMFGEVW